MQYPKRDSRDTEERASRALQLECHTHVALPDMINDTALLNTHGPLRLLFYLNERLLSDGLHRVKNLNGLRYLLNAMDVHTAISAQGYTAIIE
jgi:hypothetical protein